MLSLARATEVAQVLSDDQLRNMITRWRQFSGYDGQHDKMEQE